MLWTFRCLIEERPRSSSSPLCRPAIQMAPRSPASGCSRLYRATRSGKTWNSCRSHNLSSKLVRVSDLQPQYSSKSLTTALPPSQNAFYRPTFSSTQSLDVAALGPYPSRPSSAGSACGGVIRPTTAPQSRPGATSAPGTTNLAHTRPPLSRTLDTKSSNAPIVMANTEQQLAYALSTGLVSTLKR